MLECMRGIIGGDTGRHVMGFGGRSSCRVGSGGEARAFFSFDHDLNLNLEFITALFKSIQNATSAARIRLQKRLEMRMIF